MSSFSRSFVVILLLILPSFAGSQEVFSEDITINNNGVNLRGKFFVVNKEGKFPTLILLHGFPGNESDPLGLGSPLMQSGINVITFNYSGTFQSEGFSSFRNSLADIKAVFTFIHNPENILRFKIDTTSIIVGGYSYGGGLTMTYAINHPEIKHVISIAGNDWGEHIEDYTHNPDMKARIDASIDRVVTSGTVRFEPGAQPREIAASGLDNLEPTLYLKRNASLLVQKDILLICGWDDPVVSIDRYTLPLYRALQKENAGQVKIVAFQDNHAFRKSREDLVTKVIGWIKTIHKRN
jgi:dipeptidyl aminopeptidase/acylaminoacyl peptidase